MDPRYDSHLWSGATLLLKLEECIYSSASEFLELNRWRCVLRTQALEGAGPGAEPQLCLG